MQRIKENQAEKNKKMRGFCLFVFSPSLACKSAKQPAIFLERNIKNDLSIFSLLIEWLNCHLKITVLPTKIII